MANSEEPSALEELYPLDDLKPAGELSPEEKGEISRRMAFKALGATLGLGAFAAAASPALKHVAGMSLDDFLQRHYKELDAEDKERLIARLEEEQMRQRGVSAHIDALPPIEGVKFGYAINLSVCNGNGKCVEACHRENNHDRDTKQSYIRVLEMERGSNDMERGNTTYDHTVPAEDKFYLPVQCMQCDNPPCVSVCPVEATWKEDDGIVVVDYNWCIGCRYCEAACPYHARRFNWKEATLPPEEINPVQDLLSNRPRPVGVVEKCHFCLHKTRKGELPACAEACPTGARIFGDLNDKDSDIRWILANKRSFVLKEELGTQPSFFYYFDE